MGLELVNCKGRVDAVNLTYHECACTCFTAPLRLQQQNYPPVQRTNGVMYHEYTNKFTVA